MNIHFSQNGLQHLTEYSFLTLRGESPPEELTVLLRLSLVSGTTLALEVNVLEKSSQVDSFTLWDTPDILTGKAGQNPGEILLELLVLLRQFTSSA